MRFPPDFLDAIRNRLLISEVLGMRLPWDKRKSQPAKGDYWACCPFHHEKTPSFHVDDRRNRYHCFGCGASGDIFTFLTEKEGYSFPEAVEALAEQAGLPVPKADPKAIEKARKQKSLTDVMALAAQFFEAQLRDAQGEHARAYLQKRGLDGTIINRFQIGFAPNSRNALKEYLAGQGISHDMMVDAGLLIAGSDIPVSYDRFRNRIMFPIHDLRERVIAFGGRALSPDAPAKYLNSPETPLFHKSSVLYNGAVARKCASDAGTVIAVEGYVDVIALARAGLDHAVAPLGTALTADQLALMWKMADEPLLCFDGDEAGLRAAYKAADVALPLLKPGKSLRFVMLPDKMDPDDILTEHGPGALREMLGTAKPLFETLWQRAVQGQDFGTPERKAALEDSLRSVVRDVQDPSVRRFYGEAFRDRLQDFFRPAPAPSGPMQAYEPGGGGARGYGQSNQPYQNQQGRPGGRQAFGGHAGQGRPGQGRAKSGRQGPGAGRRGAAPGGASSELLRSGLIRGQARISAREAILVGTMIYHVALLDVHLEDFAALELDNHALGRLRADLIALVSEHEGDGDERPNLRAQLAEIGHSQVLEQLDWTLRAQGIWQAGEKAADSDAEIGWMHTLTLHRKTKTLHKELKAAERALADEPSEDNLIRLQDIQNQLATMDGREALIEGFGAHSGRGERSW